MYSITAAEVADALAEAKQPEAHSYAAVFASKIRDTEEGWTLLNAVFSLHERLDDPGYPYGPLFVADGKRSFLPEDMSDQQLSWLRKLEEEIKDAEFRARILDMLWLCSRDGKAASGAVKCYLQAGLKLEDLDRWPTSVSRYSRSYRLATQLGRKSILRTEVLEFLLARLRTYQGNDPRWFSLRLMLLLYEARHGEHAELISIARNAAARAYQEGDYDRYRDYLNFIAKLHHRDHRAEEAEEVRVQIARSYRIEAEAAEASSGGMNAHHHWEAAVKAYRDRPSLKDQVPELQKHLAAAGREALKLMVEHSHTTDISEIVKPLKARFSDQPLDVAFYSLVMFSLTDPDALRTEAEETKQGFIASMFAARFFDYEGRTVAVAPGAVTREDPGYEERTKADMQRIMGIHRGLRSQAEIAFALRIVTSEHFIEKDFIAERISDSAFIPEGRVEHYAEGLAYGFSWQFGHAALFLVPQFEAGLRHVATQVGLTPRNVQSSGVEDVWGLDRLLSEDAIVSELGAALTFELRSLLIDDYGPKFRHNLAHGLIPPDTLQGTDAAYAWWLFLKLCVVPTTGFQNFWAEHKEALQNDKLP